jgi:hypothetical protein
MKIRFVFSESSESPNWSATAVNADNPSDIVEHTKVNFNPPKPSFKPGTPPSDPLGVVGAMRRFARERHGYETAVAVKNRDFEQFKIAFIHSIQDLAVEEAALNGLVFTVENYDSEFWTPSHVLRLANALKRPRKKPSLHIIKLYLIHAWTDPDILLCDMDRKELAEHINSHCNTELHWGKQLTAANVWKLASDLGLFSNRKPGPKPKS